MDERKGWRTLQDCFEGCFAFETAWGRSGLEYAGVAIAKARARWNRWQRELDEQGYFTA